MLVRQHAPSIGPGVRYACSSGTQEATTESLGAILPDYALRAQVYDDIHCSDTDEPGV